MVTDLNKECPKNCFWLFLIDQLVDLVAGPTLWTPSEDNNQICMAEDDDKKTLFITT